MPKIIPNHFMRFGIHSEKQYFRPPEFRDCYDGVALNGNLVAYSLKGVCSFISALLAEKPYFIDPITHAFGHHPQYISQPGVMGQLVPKPAIKALAEYYGSPAENYVGKRGLRPEDFDGDRARNFTESVLDFQQSIIDRGLQETDDAKYLHAEEKTPSFLIAPYFYLASNSVQSWTDLNMKFIQLALISDRLLPIFAELLIANDAFIDSGVRKDLIKKYAGCHANGILLWIEGFSEHSASIGTLKGYRTFVNQLAETGKEIIVMYGGYFSILLRKHGITGVCHGPGYGEEREVTPVGGGMPRPKFYYPTMHMRLPYSKVAFALSTNVNSAEDYYEQVCDCDMCQQVVGTDFANFSKYGESKSGIRKDGIAFEYPTTAAKKIATAHYIFNKKREFDFVDNHDLNEIGHALDSEYQICKELFGMNDSAHLEAWHNALKGA